MMNMSWKHCRIRLSELHIMFLHFLSSFYAVMHRVSVSILLMPEMPAR